MLARVQERHGVQVEGPRTWPGAEDVPHERLGLHVHLALDLDDRPRPGWRPHGDRPVVRELDRRSAIRTLAAVVAHDGGDSATDLFIVAPSSLPKYMPRNEEKRGPFGAATRHRDVAGVTP